MTATHVPLTSFAFLFKFRRIISFFNFHDFVVFQFLLNRASALAQKRFFLLPSFAPRRGSQRFPFSCASANPQQKEALRFQRDPTTMPKDTRAYEKQTSRKNRLSCHHPYSNPEKVIVNGSSSEDVDIEAQKKEWDNAICLICLEHPHNAVLLLCSSYDKGCRPYMCDTSSRHSNCLDQFRKPRTDFRSASHHGIELYVDRRQVEAPGLFSSTSSENNITDSDRTVRRRSFSLSRLSRSAQSMTQLNSVGSVRLRADRRGSVADGGSIEGQASSVNPSSNRDGTEILVNDAAELKCPLCRGEVTGWKVIEAAREYLNAKPRNCSHESCTFRGTYKELRKHARSVHPTVKPAEVDPARQRAWRDSELSRDFDDMISSIRSAMPNASMFGDYIIDNEEGTDVDHDDGGSSLSTVTGSWWTRFFLVHMFGPITALADGRRFSARWRAPRRQPDNMELLSGRSLWWGELGENRLENGDEDADHGINFNISSESRNRRRFPDFGSGDAAA
eukprot:TRINITY_DN5367_c0_g1_i1.p1 TRINITY_DN5367_c0_g1~~TRINITY_DN5367_c0_g1_i1.p1  ORF type:complete len:505 (-),score=87.87 TRINITY_DN5367_c0_g1_i1:423-1937(-)